ncbi:MAG: TRAP transporter small permease [Thermoleophilia bacterium]|nr:TRAP transporter small permease [Thermoleophilia bacterium]
MLDKLSSWLAAGAGVAIGVMMLLMVADAISRKVIGSIPGGYNSTVGLLTLVLFLPQGYAQMKRQHIVVDLVTDRLPPRVQVILAGVGALLGVGVFGVLTWAGAQKAWEATEAGEEWMGATFYPAWPFRWMIPIGLGILTLQLVATAVEEFRTLRERS